MGFTDNKTTADLMVLMVAFTICFSVIATGATIAVVEVFHPGVDTDGAVSMVRDVLNTLIGLLAGFLAGRVRAPGESSN